MKFVSKPFFSLNIRSPPFSPLDPPKLISRQYMQTKHLPLHLYPIFKPLLYNPVTVVYTPQNS